MPSLLAELLKNSTTKLADAGVDNPALDARILLASALNCERIDLLRDDRAPTPEQIAHFYSLIERRVKREPVLRILGLREFWGLPFGLNEATLDPRADSEILVETTLALLGERKSKPLRLLDLGTGTGCLLLALLHELPNAVGIGIDLAPRAVEQATANAARLNLTERAMFRTGNWLENISEKFDLIISNPPYIAAHEIPTLMPEVRDYDPVLALVGGDDGLAPYHLLIPQLPALLNPQGLAVFEIGQGQEVAVTKLFQTAGFSNITTHKDLGGVVRCVVGRKV